MRYSVAAVAIALIAWTEAFLGSDGDYKLPLGLHLPNNLNVRPTSAPPEDCVDVWHPSHRGVDMDGCDNDEEDGWHWVHPGDPTYPDQPPHVWTTQVMTATHMSTIIDCPVHVPNCPGSLYTTIVVPKTTTICPVIATTHSAHATDAYTHPASSTDGHVPPVKTTSCSGEKETTTRLPPLDPTSPCESEQYETPTLTSTWSATWKTSSRTYDQPSVSTHPPERSSILTQPPVEHSTHSGSETAARTSSGQHSHGSAPMPSSSKTATYPPPAGYTTATPSGPPGYCPGPGCPSPTTVVITTQSVYQIPPTSAVPVTGAAAQHGHHVGGLAAVVAVAAALL